MLKNHRTRKLGKLFVAEHGDGDFHNARGFVHKRHVQRAAARAQVNAEQLIESVQSHGVAVAQQYSVKYRRADGAWREVILSAPTEEAAVALADRRMHEQYGDGAFEQEARERSVEGAGYTTYEANLLRRQPDLHMDNYEFESIEEVV